MHYSLFVFLQKPRDTFPCSWQRTSDRSAVFSGRLRRTRQTQQALLGSQKHTHTHTCKSMDLLFLHDIFFDGAELLQSAGHQVPLVLLFQARVLLAQLEHLVLELLNAPLLLLQQLLLGLDDVVELLQVLGRLAGVFRRVLHVAVRETPVHGDRFVDAAARSRTGCVPIRRGARSALSPLAHCLRSLLLSRLRVKKLRCSSAPSTGSAPQSLPSEQALCTAAGEPPLTLSREEPQQLLSRTSTAASSV